MSVDERPQTRPDPGEAGGAGDAPRRAFIVANVLPRWVSDFNVVSTRLVEAGYDVTVYVSAPDPKGAGWRSTDAVGEVRDRLAPEVHLEFLSYSAVQVAPVAFLRNLLLALRLGRRHPDALFVLWTSIPILTWGPALRVLRRQVLYMVTGLGPVFASASTNSRRRFIVEKVEKFLFRSRRCRILVHNRDDKGFLCRTYGLPDDRVVVTGGCGVDPAEFPMTDLPARTPDRVPVVLVPVRLLVDKGVLDAADASKRLAAEGIDHEMWFTSNLDPTHPTALTADDLDRITRSTPTVKFLGYQRSLDDAYQACDVVCVPTYFPEGLPTALLEAASVGRPIVTCDNVGGRDFIRDDVDGLVVPPRSPDRLAAALGRLLTDPDEAERMRLSAHARFLAGYTKQDMLDLTVEAIESARLPGWPADGRRRIGRSVGRREPAPR